MANSSQTTDIKMADKEILFFAVRHGTTELNSNGSFRGNRNVPLTGKGIKDAENISKVLEGQPVGIIYCSDLRRAVKTAKIIKEKLKLTDIKIVKTKLLRPLNVGVFAGKPKNKDNLTKLNAYIKNTKRQIPEGESVDDFKARVTPVLEKIVKEAKAGKNPLLVAHSSLIHELGHFLLKDHKSLLIAPGGIVMGYEENGKVRAEVIYKPHDGPGNPGS